MLIEQWASEVLLITALFTERLPFVPWNGFLSIVFIFSLTLGKRNTHGTHLKRA